MTATLARPSRPDVRASHVGGGRVLTITDHMLPIVHFTLAWRHGALTDPPASRGALAMLLPMLLRGTKRKSRAVFHAELEQLGSSLDASVGFELAMVRGSCLRQHLAATWALLTEALREPALTSDALADLRQEATEGLINERDDDDSVAELFLRQQYYRGTALCGPAIGSKASLHRLTVDDLQAARANLCAPWATCAFAGSIEPEQAEQAAGALFASLAAKAPAAPAPPNVPQASQLAAAGRPPAQPRVLLVDKAERTQAQVRIALPGLPPSHPDNDLFWLGCVAFGGTFNSLLTREVRERRGWSYVASADYRRRGLFASPVVLRTAPANADAAPCVRLQLSLLAGLARGEHAAEDHVQARDYLVGRSPFRSATAFDVLGPALLLDVLGLPFSLLWDEQARLRRMDLARVPQVMQRYLGPAVPEVVVVGSQAALLAPLQAEFGGDCVSVVPYTDGL